MRKLTAITAFTRTVEQKTGGLSCLLNSDSGSVNNNSSYEWTLCRGIVMNGLCVFWENMQNTLYLLFSLESGNLRLKAFTINMNFISYIKRIKMYCIVWKVSRSSA